MFVLRLLLLAMLALADGTRTQDSMRSHLAAREQASGLQPHAISMREAAKQGNVAALVAEQEAGAHLDGAVDQERRRPAHYAAAYGQVAVLQFLREVGVNLTAGDEDGWTPAHSAASNGEVAVLELLHQAKADLEAPDKLGDTPAHSAAIHGHVGALKFLIQAGVNLNRANKFGETPADKAAIGLWDEALELLLKAGGRRNDEEAPEEPREPNTP